MSDSDTFMQPQAGRKNITAVIGPTNTGKTHLAIERMLGHESGLIGLPLRLLAREVYDRVVARVGPARVALITGEERIKPANPSYYISTVEAMPQDVDVEFLAIDEVQLAGDPERGHVFTDRVLHARGNSETLLLGASTMRNVIETLLPDANFIVRPRLSKLSYGGQKKLSRLPRRTAIVAFSSEEVYSIAELIRRQRGGAAVVMGALSPRTRNAQVALYQSGDVDFLIATDAIGMGLNLDIDHVAFAGCRKFDGQLNRELSPGELAQIAGRAGRHMNDGTFGVTGQVEPFEQGIVERLENHDFEPLKNLIWRNRALDFASLDRLKESLKEPSTHMVLSRGRMADDMVALENASRMSEVRDMTSGPASVKRLWEVCQVPDYRKISTTDHVELVARLYSFLMATDPMIPEDWFASQVEFSDRIDGDIDTLANRIAHIRTWTFVSNKTDWLNDPAHWQGRTREIEDSLSDALHEKLTQRFVDKRTSVLIRRLRDQDELFAEISDDGAVHVEKHFVGRLDGFVFTHEDLGEGVNAKAARHAASRILGDEFAMRARRVIAAKHEAFSLNENGFIVWKNTKIARLQAGDDPLKPSVQILADEHLPPPDKEKVQSRIEKWISEEIDERLKPLVSLSSAEDITGLARGVGYQIIQNFGILRREDVAKDIAALDQTARSQLRRYGVRFGAFNIFIPVLLKPAASDLLLLLWALKSGREFGIDTDSLPTPPRGGLTSVATDPALPEAFYKVAGFHVCGPRSVRVDMLERLADMIRPLVAWRNNNGKLPAESTTTKTDTAQEENSTGDGRIKPALAKPSNSLPKSAPEGATGDGGFTATATMMSILGCSPDELAQVLKSLGFRAEKKAVEPAAPAGPVGGDAGAGADATQKADAPEKKADPFEAGATDRGTATVDDTADSNEGAAPNGAVEPEFIYIWRPRKRRRMAQRQAEGGRGKPSGGKAKGKPARGKRKGTDGRSKPGHGRQRNRNKPGDAGSGNGPGFRNKQRAVDPDSPFAALAKLKDKLEEKT